MISKKTILVLLLTTLVFLFGFHIGRHEMILLKIENKILNYINKVNELDSDSYVVTTYERSYFKKDSIGGLKVDKNNLPIVSEDYYYFKRTLYPKKTAIIVMDPWIDAPDKFLNDYYNKLMDSTLIPFIYRVRDKGHPVYILTNNPLILNYSAKIHPKLEELSKSKENVKVLYHQLYNDEKFAELLYAEGINSIIYTGYASNMCIIGRKMGMANMYFHGFKLYFVPEVSAAVEFRETWKTGSLHKFATDLISSNFAEIISFSEIMNKN
jgi:hypothetical protein